MQITDAMIDAAAAHMPHGSRDLAHAALRAALTAPAPSAAEPVKTLHIMDDDEQKVMARALMRSVQVIAPSAPSAKDAVGEAAIANAAFEKGYQHGQQQGLQRAEYRAAIQAPASAPVAEPVAQLMRFYGVSTVEALIAAQDEHVARLQSKLPATPSMAPTRVREG